MWYATSSIIQLARAGMALRVVTVALAGFAVALSGQPATPVLIALGSGYAAIAGLLRLLESRPGPAWLAYPSAVIDVLFVTALVVLLPESSLQTWVLYLPPLAVAAMSTPPVALAMIGLSLSAYVGAVWIDSGTVAPSVAWSAATLAVAAFAMIVLAGKSAVERKEKRTWQELACTARGLSQAGDVEQVAAAVVERARRLVRARASWLWWCDSAEGIRPGAQAGALIDQPLAFGALGPMLVWKLDHSPTEPVSFGEPLANLTGEALALYREGARFGILAVVWEGYPPRREARRALLRVFKPWATNALIAAKASAAVTEALRRQTVLQQAAAEMTAAIDRQSILEIAVRAARSGSGAAVDLADVTDSDHASVESPRAEATSDANASARGGESQAASDDELLVPIDAHAALRVRGLGVQRDLANRQGLESLADTARSALGRCARYERVAAEVAWLRESLEAIPAPFSIRDATGQLLMSSTAYQASLLSTVPIIEAAATGVRERELAVGDPARVFIAQTTPVAGGCTVALYREITKEREALRSKDELIAMVGHELRGPLTSIQGYSQMMAHQIGIVQRQVVQLNRLIGDFMDASRMADGHLPLSRQLVDPIEIARSAAERFRGSNEGRVLQLDLAEVRPISGDPLRLGQVLDNLLSNAAKYSSPDQEVVLSVAPRGDEVAISVRDSGMGVAPEFLPHLFERFYRVPNAETKKAKGLGLGLSIVRDLVIAHGGRVWAESPGVGKGSTFWIALPVKGGQEQTVGLSS